MKIVPTILNSSSFDSKLQVDSVHVMDKVVVSGSRDRGISVWSIDQGIRILVDYITFEKMSTIVFNRTSSFLQRAISGSWDNTVKFWQATPTGLKEGRRALNLKVRKENSFGV